MPAARAWRGRWPVSLRWLWPLVLLGAIAWPEWSHQQFDRNAPGVSPDHAAADPDRLREIAAMDVAELDLLDIAPGSGERAIAAGSIDIPGLSWGSHALQGYPHDIDKGPPTFRWFMAGLGLERTLLNEYQASGDARLLDTAEARVLQFAVHERGRRWDLGFLWNDHSVANRASVLVQLWALRTKQRLDWRRSPAAKELLALVQRSAELLADPRHFTARTNHGWIQSLALLQLSAAFPGLPHAAAWRDIAERRLRLQLPFYVSPEGVVLEHSPRYHAIGGKLLAQVQRLRHLHGLPAWQELDAAVVRSERVTALLLRPDGTVPGIGNSDAATRHYIAQSQQAGAAPLRWGPYRPGRPAGEQAVLPVAGWALNWMGEGETASQLMISWAKHDGHGHKHADEGGLNWWAMGQDWINPVGYWPYGIALVRESYGWQSGNAAHGRNENARSERQSRLLAHGRTEDAAMFDVERRRGDGARFRRQVLHLGTKRLLALDFLDQVNDGGELVWNFSPRVQLGRVGEQAWASTPRADGLRLQLALASVPAVESSLIAARDSAIPGWTTAMRVPQRGQSLQVRTPGSAVTASLFELHGDGAAVSALRFEQGAQNATDWTLILADGSRISRRGDRVQLPGGSLQLGSATVPEESLQRVRAAHAAALAAYPPFRSLYAQRVKVGKGVLGLALCIELVLLLAWLWRRRQGALAALQRRPPVELGLALAWAAVALFLLGSHLRI